MPVETLRRNLKYLRNRKNLTQATVSELCGKSRGLYTHWELGTSLPITEDLVNLSNLYGVTIDDLVRVELVNENLNSFN